MLFKFPLPYNVFFILSRRKCGLRGEELLTKLRKLLPLISLFLKSPIKTPALSNEGGPWPVLPQSCDFLHMGGKGLYCNRVASRHMSHYYIFEIQIELLDFEKQVNGVLQGSGGQECATREKCSCRCWARLWSANRGRGAPQVRKDSKGALEYLYMKSCPCLTCLFSLECTVNMHLRTGSFQLCTGC